MSAPAPLVSIGIVTWNAAADLEPCLAAVRAQDHQPIEILIGDNGSTDGTRAILDRLTEPGERVWFGRNLGFSAAHNALIARSRGAYYLCLNPDVTLDSAFVTHIVRHLEATPRAGSASGCLLRRDEPGTLDSTGIVMLPTMRHLDRGGGEQDTGQFTRVEEVFGASGAAAVYRRAMLDDTQVLGEYFDEEFFAYREDADLAWRAQMLGWRCLYVPDARAWHGRRVTPERRGALPADINRYSVRNRFLLRIKNQPFGHALRFLLPTLARDAQVVGYVLLREWSSIPGLLDVLRLLPGMLRKRRIIMRRRTMQAGELAAWFRSSQHPAP